MCRHSLFQIFYDNTITFFLFIIIWLQTITPLFHKPWLSAEYEQLQETSRKYAAIRVLLAACFMLVSCLAYASTQKMEAVYHSEMSADIQQPSQLYIPEDRNFHSPCMSSLRIPILYVLPQWWLSYWKLEEICHLSLQQSGLNEVNTSFTVFLHTEFHNIMLHGSGSACILSHVWMTLDGVLYWILDLLTTYGL
jgi:hypothetical protein